MEDIFIKAFSGLQRNFGVADLSQTTIDPSTGKAKPVYKWVHRAITKNDYLEHLNGSTSIGIQPCDDQGMARFGAIDIDDKQPCWQVVLVLFYSLYRQYCFPSFIKGV